MRGYLRFLKCSVYDMYVTCTGIFIVYVKCKSNSPPPLPDCIQEMQEMQEMQVCVLVR